MSAVQDITDFTWVDRSKDPDFYRRFLDLGNAVPGIQASKPIILNALRIGPGQQIIDVGCGTGADVFAIAERVGPAGGVTGVDISAAMIDEARRRTPPGLPVEFLIGDASALPFEDETFDGARTERLLMHVHEPHKVLSEMARVVRSGGRVSVFDFDWETFFIDHADRELTRIVVNSFCDNLKSGWIGRNLPRLFASAGLGDVGVTPHVILIDFEFFGVLLGGHLDRLKGTRSVPPRSLKLWWRGLRQAHAEERFFAGFVAFIVGGTKPK